MPQKFYDIIPPNEGNGAEEPIKIGEDYLKEEGKIEVKKKLSLFCFYQFLKKISTMLLNIHLKLGIFCLIIFLESS